MNDYFEQPAMKIVNLIKIEILVSGELVVQPESNVSGIFDFIYRAAEGVNWDKAHQAFIAPCPKEITYVDWFQIIIKATASELGTKLEVTDQTLFLNVSSEVKQQISAAGNRK